MKRGPCNQALQSYQAAKGRRICAVYGPYSTGWVHSEKKRARARALRVLGKSLLVGAGVVAPVVAFAWAVLHG